MIGSVEPSSANRFCSAGPSKSGNRTSRMMQLGTLSFGRLTKKCKAEGWVATSYPACFKRRSIAVTNDASSSTMCTHPDTTLSPEATQHIKKVECRIPDLIAWVRLAYSIRHGSMFGSFGGRPKARDRATGPIENIWCEQIRGCSYRGAGP